MSSGKIYAGVKGLIIDIPIFDGENNAIPYDSISACRLDVIPPKKTEADLQTWPATAVEPNVIRHIVPEETNLVAGRYKIQPYIETIYGFKGHTQPVEMTVHELYKR